MSNQQPALAASPVPADLKAYDLDQRKRTLSSIIWIVVFASAILGLFDIQFHTWPSVLASLGLALLCIPIMILNRRGHYVIAASALSLIVLLVITINLLNGDGVRDPGIMAYPMFAMVGTLFFGRRAAPYFAAAAVVSMLAVVSLEVLGLVRPTIGRVGYGVLIPMVTLMLTAVGLIWVIVKNMESNLKRVEASEFELRKNYDLTLQAWAKVMEYRDRETEGHSRRLVELGTKLARALGVQESEIVQLQRGALLHDIGKLAIPDEILFKPSALDEDEFKIMQMHPVYARQMLAGIPFLQPSVAVAYSHHERWDGQGYPEGLKGEEIPLTARLFAVVDTWDALSSERVYRAAWPSDQIKAYIKANAGVKFDPHIVEVFLRIV